MQNKKNYKVINEDYKTVVTHYFHFQYLCNFNAISNLCLNMITKDIRDLVLHQLNSMAQQSAQLIGKPENPSLKLRQGIFFFSCLFATKMAHNSNIFWQEIQNVPLLYYNHHYVSDYQLTRYQYIYLYAPLSDTQQCITKQNILFE